MEEMFQFSPRDEEEAKQLTSHLREVVGPSMHDGDIEKIIKFLQETAQKGITRDVFGLHPVLTSLQTACIIVDEIGLRRDSVIATLLYGCLADDYDNIAKTFGDNVARIVHGLAKIQKLYEKNPVVESDNFRNLLLSFEHYAADSRYQQRRSTTRSFRRGQLSVCSSGSQIRLVHTEKRA